MSVATYGAIVCVTVAGYTAHRMAARDLRSMHTAEAVAAWVKRLNCESTDAFLDAVMAHISHFTYEELTILLHRYERLLQGLVDPCGEHAFCLTLVYSALRLCTASFTTSTRDQVQRSVTHSSSYRRRRDSGREA